MLIKKINHLFFLTSHQNMVKKNDDEIFSYGFTIAHIYMCLCKW